mmetsp:Transcript_42125/g.100414  ORF Transcript_42125/g.100414 Transcript_42125/m.100414 type:complete len:81 (+) Transcript_42125:72-314(+)
MLSSLRFCEHVAVSFRRAKKCCIFARAFLFSRQTACKSCKAVMSWSKRPHFQSSQTWPFSFVCQQLYKTDCTGLKERLNM